MAIAAGVALAAVSLAAASSRSSTQSIAPASQQAVAAKCPAGSSVTAIGAIGKSPPGPGQALLPSSLTRASSRVAISRATNLDSSNAGDFTTIAYCGNSPPLSTASASTIVGQNAQESVTAKCPRGTSVRLGGFNEDLSATYQGPFVEINGLERSSPRRWEVSATNLNSHAGQLEALAYCGAGAKNLQTVRKTINLGAYETKIAIAKCPRHHRLIMGGLETQHYAANHGDIEIVAIERISARAWAVIGYKFKAAVGHLTAIAYCN